MSRKKIRDRNKKNQEPVATRAARSTVSLGIGDLFKDIYGLNSFWPEPKYLGTVDFKWENRDLYTGYKVTVSFWDSLTSQFDSRDSLDLIYAEFTPS